MAGLLSIDLDGAVALVTLQRPEKRNALSIDLRLELADAFGRLADDRGVSCVVLTGAGSTFCAGMDVTQFGGDRAHKQRLVDTSLAAFGTVARFPKPLWPRVNGPAIAGGFVLALHCDLRLASETARFGFSELPRGIPPSYAAALSGLPEPRGARAVPDRPADGGAEALHHAPGGRGRARHRRWSSARWPWPVGSPSSRSTTLLEVKRRILLAADHARGPLFADEERALRVALLGDEGPDEAA